MVMPSRPGMNSFQLAFAGSAIRRFDHAEAFGAVVGADEERVAAVGGVVLGFVDAREKYAEFAGRLIFVQVADFGRQRTVDVDEDVGAAAGAG